MINLRFHIVSITAVFLALAIGIFMGTSLLQRATVDSLKAGQKSLESKIEQRQRENTAYRDALGTADDVAADFGDEALAGSVAGRLDGPVLLVASRGIDEDSLGEVSSTLREAGASIAGTVWTDDGSTLEDESVREAVAAALDVPAGDAATMRRRVTQALEEALGGSLATNAQPNQGSATTTVAPAAGQPADATALVQALSDAGAVTWEPAQEAAKIPAQDLRVVVVSGEGATTDADRVLYPLIRALGTDRPGAVLAGEIMSPRSSVAEIERDLDGLDPPRGAFVGPIRGDALREDVTTIDDLDSPYGRLALVLALAQPPGSAAGAYGISAGADSQYPARTT
jgi:hypothetical protein